MKIVSLKLLFFITSNICFSQGSGFVKLDGRQFKNENGDDFYPMICNYGFDITFSTTGNYYLSPNNSYGEGYSCPTCDPLPNYDYDHDNQADALLQIRAELARIKNMRFNAIRTYGLAPFKSDPGKFGVIGFKIKAKENKHPIWDSTAITEFIPITPIPNSYDSPLNTNVQLLFSFYDIVLQEAEAVGLKVLLDIAYDDLAAHSVNAIDYAEYLKALADRYKNNSTLMAYVVIEEPAYNQHNSGKSKQEICDFTSMWYDAIRTRDSNHLITAGGTWVLDFMEWDPCVMKVDFYCPHLYPDIKNYEGYSYSAATDRVLCNLFFIANNIPMPWVIGETGFSAYDDSYYNPQHNPQVILSPEVDGTIQEQANYAQLMLDAVRNTKGSGFSWWNFQEHWWGHELLRENGYGLLRHGSLTNSNIEKPVTQIFRNYPDPPPAPSSISPPANYFNPFNVGANTPNNSNEENAVSGYVIDAVTGRPIKDAIVFAWNWLEDLRSNRGNIYSILYSFTDTFGYYKIVPYNFIQPYSGYHRIIHMKITASGAERIDFGHPTRDWEDVQLPNSFYNASLKLVPLHYDGIIQNKIIDYFSNQVNFKGWNSLSIKDVWILPGAETEFIARNEINITGEFHSQYQTESHLFLSQTFNECTDFSNFLRVKFENNSEIDPLVVIDKEIEVDFKPFLRQSSLEISPNPSNGLFSIELQSANETEAINEIQIYHLTGKFILANRTNSYKTQIDLRGLSKAIYYLKASTNYNVYYKKIIIN